MGLATAVFAQSGSKTIPELWLEYGTAANDSIRFYTLSSLASAFVASNPDSAIILAQAALAGAQTARLRSVEAAAYVSSGEAYDVSGKLEPALENFAKGLTIYQQLKSDEGLSRAYNSRGLAHYFAGQIEAAIPDFEAAQRLAEGDQNLVQLAKIYHNLGMAYSRQKDKAYPALKSYLRARNLKDSLVNSGFEGISARDQISTYTMLGSFYQQLGQLDKARESIQVSLKLTTPDQPLRQLVTLYNLGNVEEQDSNYVKAQELYQQALDIAIANNFLPNQTFIYNALGNTSRELKSMERAATYYQQALLLLEAYNNPEVYAGVLNDQGTLFVRQGNFSAGRANGEEALRVATEGNFRQKILEAHDLLARAAEGMGDQPAAAFHLRKYTDLKSIIDGESQRQELIGLQAVMDVELATARYEKELRDQELVISKQWISRLIIALAAIALLAILLAFARRKLALTNQQLEVSNDNLADNNIQLASTNQQLSLANNKLQQFAFATGHDLKESLRNITSFTQLASIEMAEDLSTAQSHLKEAAAGGVRMRKMLDDLLHYSNLGGNDTVTASFPLEEVVSSVKQQLKEEIVLAQGDVHLTTPATIKANRVEIEQLFYNLIHNALRYRSPETPARISIQLEQRLEEVVFKIKDNGLGIAAEQRENIFKPFHRLHNRSKSGSGLGLSICQKVVEIYGGKIWYEPVAEGGSLFCFTLPQAEPKGAFAQLQ
jgi:signal transduction histidine kinase